MAKDIPVVFANSGDKTDIPEGVQPDGSVSYENGWGADYEIDPNAGGKRLEKNNFNGLFNLLTINQKELVDQGVINHIVGKEYLVNAKVRGVDGNNYTANKTTTTAPPSADWDLEGGSSELPSITGTATFTNATNTINLTGIGLLDIEIGDVLIVTDSVSNNTEFTLEVITDDDNIIVNQAHAGGTTTKSLVGEVATAGVTISLLSKYYNASLGLGQGYVQVSRSSGATNTNNTGRTIEVAVTFGVTDTCDSFVDGLLVLAGDGITGVNLAYSFPVQRGSTYIMQNTLSRVVELR